MATKPFEYQEMFPMGKDTTEYYHLTSDYVRTETFNGREMLVVDPEALTVLARQATHDNAFMLRREHNEMVAKILHDPEASANDKYVALTMLRNAEVAAKGQLPFCQDTGTAIIMGKKDRTSTPAAAMKSGSQKAFTLHTRRTISAIRRTHPSRCMTR